MNRALALLLCLLFASSIGAAESAGARPGVALKAGVFEPPRTAPEFSLQGSDGGELKLGRYRGKVILLSFGFTNCAAVCPTTLATLAQARKLLGKAADAVQVVYVTVDPERDDAVRMKNYLGVFDPSFVGATGKPEALGSARKSYGIVAVKHPMGDSYVMEHSSSVFLIDREGKLRAVMPYGHAAGDYVHDIKLLLAQ
ncbi:MAG: SCO family protein [Caldimonas sp.]